MSVNVTQSKYSHERQSRARVCTTCGCEYFSISNSGRFCSRECYLLYERQQHVAVDVVDSQYNSSEWLIVKDATPPEEGGFVNGVSRFIGYHFNIMGADRCLAPGTIVQNIKTGEKRVVDYSLMPKHVTAQRIKAKHFTRSLE